MTATYKHGTYGEFAKSVVTVSADSATTVVYVGTAPVNLIRGYSSAGLVNNPVLLTSINDVYEKIGYSSDWASFSLCEAFKVHFANPAGNAGPIVAINVLDPSIHKKASETTVQLAFTNGRATISSDTIIMDTLVLADKVYGTDFTAEYDFANKRVIIDSVGTKITGNVAATFSEIDVSTIAAETIIGGATAGGTYAGFGAVELIYQQLGLIPNVLVAPRWSEIPAVYEAMINAGTKINGHWDAFVLADLPIAVGDTKIDTIATAISWAAENNYTSERSKIFWPQATMISGEILHTSTLCAWKMQNVDSSHNGIPMETPSNKVIPVIKQYFGEGSSNRGFDQSRANTLNADGITTVAYFGGQWVLWGGHTAAYKHGATADSRAIFDNSIRMMMHITNRFQSDWAMTIDEPMTLALAETIKQREQEKADALVAIGALIGSPVVHFVRSANSDSAILEGNFVWDFEATPTPQLKSATMRVAYSTAGFNSYFGEEV